VLGPGKARAPKRSGSRVCSSVASTQVRRAVRMRKVCGWYDDDACSIAVSTSGVLGISRAAGWMRPLIRTGSSRCGMYGAQRRLHGEW